MTLDEIAPGEASSSLKGGVGRIWEGDNTVGRHLIHLLVMTVMLWGFARAADAAAQEGEIQEAKALDEQVAQLYAQGRYSEAIPLAQRALAIKEKVLGTEHPGTARALRLLGNLYRDSAAYAQAERLYRRALAIQEKVLGLAHPDTAMSLNNLAGLYHTMGAYTQAEPLYRRALAIHEKVLGPEHPDTARLLNNLAGLYQDMGAYTQAEPLLQRALAITEKTLGPDHPHTARSLNNLAELYRFTGAYGQAEPLYRRALAIHEKVLGLEHPDTATSLYNLAALYQDTGAYAEAEPLYQRALTIREKKLGPEHPDTATSLNNLAGLYQDMGAYTQAEPLYRRALAITEKSLGPDHPDTAASLNGLALLYSATGAYARAELLHQRALAITEKSLGPEHPATVRSLKNLALVYHSRGTYAQAELLYRRALAISEKTLGPSHPDTALALNNLAGLYHTTGAYTEAEPLYRRALAIHEKVLGPEHPATANSLNNLALLYRATGAYSQAEPLYRRALSIRESVLGPEHPHIAVSLTNLALLHWAAGRPTTALPLLERAQVIQEKNATGFLLTGSEARKQGYLQRLRGYTFVNVTLSLALSDDQATRLGLTSVLQAKGRVLDALTRGMASLWQRVSPEIRLLFDQFAAVAEQLSNLTYQGLGNLSSDAYRQRLRELAVKQEQLETELTTRSADVRGQVAPLTFAAIQLTIPPDAALVEWFRFHPLDPKANDQNGQWRAPRYVAYVLSRDGEPAVVDVGEAEVIERLIQDFRTGLSDPKSTFVKEVARELSDKLVKPLRPHLGHAERWFISPDGALNLVPFAALVDETGALLASQVEITYLTSGRDLLRFGDTPGANDEAVVVADPDYGKVTGLLAEANPGIQLSRSVDMDRGEMVFTPLPGTAEEAKILKFLLNSKDENLLIQAKATEDRVKELHGPRILHVATHGFFLKDNELPAAALKTVSFSHDQGALPLGENPLLRSGLALAGANTRQSGEHDDGILTAAEVAQMDLRGTQLVVLSACETGVGEVQNGEGVYGLRRALVLAGAETQVASLWKVADDATKDLMVDYYQRLLKGEGRSAALRNAQLTMLNSYDRSHPYYWAAFVPIGNGAPLTQSRY